MVLLFYDSKFEKYNFSLSDMTRNNRDKYRLEAKHAGITMSICITLYGLTLRTPQADVDIITSINL